jgi:hypothetical protein
MKEKIQAMDDLMYAMKDSIKEFVKSKGGFIRMKGEWSYASAITYSSSFFEVEERDVTAIAVFEDRLYISHKENITPDEDDSGWYLLDCDEHVELQTIYQLAKELYFNNY